MMKDLNSLWEQLAKEILVIIGDIKLLDTNIIYSRTMGLLASARDIDIKYVLRHQP